MYLIFYIFEIGNGTSEMQLIFLFEKIYPN